MVGICLLKTGSHPTKWPLENERKEKNKFMGEGRFPQEGAETSCCPEVGMPRADTFTR